MDPSQLTTAALASPYFLRVGVGVLGVVVLVRGAAIYEIALRLLAFCAGAVFSVTTVSGALNFLEVPVTPTMLGVAGVIGGVTALGTAVMAHRTALLGVGAIGGASLAVALGAVLVEVAPLWLPLVGALVGAVTAPLLYKQLLKTLTPLLGALALAWAAGHPDDLRIVAALWALGTVIQVLSIGSPSTDDEDR